MQIAARLLPGEFSAPLLDLINGSAAEGGNAASADAELTPLVDLVPRVARIAATLRSFAASRGWIEAQVAASRGELRQILQTGRDRMLRIAAGFSSTGLDAGPPGTLLRELAALNDPALQLEVVTVVGELEWRLRDLERESPDARRATGDAHRMVQSVCALLLIAHRQRRGTPASERC